MSHRRILSGALVGIAILLMTAALSSATMFDFTTGAMGSGFGNSIVVTNDAVTATLTGWGLATSSGATFKPSQVRRWSTGVGSCNQLEGLNCGNGPHTVGNNKGLDVLLISFSRPVLLTSAVITAWASDFDASFWGGAGSFSMTGNDLSDLGDRHDSNFSGSVNVGATTRTVTLSVIETEVTWLAFGAKPGQTNDKFKFRELAVTPVTTTVPPTTSTPPTTTPEPSALLLLALGAVGVLTSRGTRSR